MRSSSGEYFEKLDHVRAFACYSVFVWHVSHGPDGAPVPYGYSPSFFPLALLDEGHIGVAVFMCLSGYLFAKILDGAHIVYKSFVWNRFVRLAPLLLLVMFAAGVKLVAFQGFDLRFYLKTLVWGFVYPTWPNGGWSITTELHFYILLPALLYVTRKSVWLGLLLIAAAVALRTGLYFLQGEVQTLAYWTIVGRFDQFAAGIIAYRLSEHARGRHLTAAAIFLAFSLFYSAFDSAGGFFHLKSPYPSTSALWIVLPTIQGACISYLIAYYDRTDLFEPGRISRFIATIGGVSYSIYLLHFFIAFPLAGVLAAYHLSYPATLAAVSVAFLGMIPIGLASFRFIESPFLRFRLRYKRSGTAAPAGPLPEVATLP